MRRKVILDTNALLLFAQGIDLFSELAAFLQEPYTLLLPDCVEEELRTLAAGSGKKARAAKLALVLAQQQALKKVHCSGEYADDAIVAIAEDDVVTLDKGLQRRLLDKGVRVLTIRQRRIREV